MQKGKPSSVEGKMSASSQPQVTPERIMQFVWGYAPPLILEAAIRHRVFDVLDGGTDTQWRIAASRMSGTA